jgi:nucleotide-binding universal stress UspA family protein
MQPTSGTIVVGIDDSASSRLAMDWAVGQALAEGCGLTLVHALDVSNAAVSMVSASYPSEARMALGDAGHRLLEEARGHIRLTAPGLEVHQVFRLEDPRHVLVELSQDARMLVVGSRGRGPVRALLLGSVSVALARHAHCPVIVHRPGGAGAVPHGIVVGVDGTADSAAVLDFAYRQAALRDLPLTVVLSVWDVQTSMSGSFLVSDLVTTMESEELALSEIMAGKGEDYPDVKTTTEIARGLPYEVLVGLSGQMNLLVVGSRRGHRLSHLVAGSVSTAAVEHATCPVAVIPV